MGCRIAAIRQPERGYLTGIWIEEIPCRVDRVAQAVPEPALHETVIVGGIAKVGVSGSQKEVKTGMQKGPHSLG